MSPRFACSILHNAQLCDLGCETNIAKRNLGAATHRTTPAMRQAQTPLRGASQSCALGEIAFHF